MPNRWRRWLAGMGLVLSGCVAGAGCQTSALTSACAPAAPVIRMAGPDARPETHLDARNCRVTAGTLIQWRITSRRNPADPGMDGKAVVRADGQIDLGPFGFVRVGGLTVQEAANAIRAHVARQVPGAAVHVGALPPAARVAAARRPAEPVMTPRGSEGGPELDSPAVTLTGGRREPGAGPNVAQAALPVSPPDLSTTLTEAAGAEPAGKGTTDKAADKSAADKTADKEATGTSQGPVVAENLIPPPGYAHGPHGAPNELAKVSLPPYRIEPPDVLEVDYEVAPAQIKGDLLVQQIHGPRLVRPDGTISLGIYGTVHVAGLTLEQARYAIATRVKERITNLAAENLVVDIAAFNSKWYYVVTDGAGYGEQIFRFPVTGSETVIDALAQIGGLPPQASKKHVWVARRTPDGGPAHILPVDYIGMAQGGLTGTNYQVLPGDRIYVKADCFRTFDTEVAKYLSPFERILGATLLGSEVVNSIKSGSTGTGTGAGTTR